VRTIVVFIPLTLNIYVEGGEVPLIGSLGVLASSLRMELIDQ